MKAGYPDLSVEIVTEHYAGLRIELKRGNLGSLDDKQQAVIERLNDEGYYAIVCNTLEMAVDVIQRYVNGERLERPVF